MTATPETKKFIKTFNTFTYSRDWNSVFRDFTEIAALTIHQQPYHLGAVAKDEEYEAIEKQYLEIVKKYKREELEVIVQLFSYVQTALLNQPFDFLGSVYMELEMHNKHNGEFFTPSPVAKMMAIMTLGSGKIAEIEDKGYITIGEPACGSGVMLIESINAMREAGYYDPRKAILFHATDINRMCCNMCYIQLGILGIPGYVMHGNTITMEMWEARPTPQLRIYQHLYKQEKQKPSPILEPGTKQLAFNFESLCKTKNNAISS